MSLTAGTNFNPTQQAVLGQFFARKPGKLW
jgi:hypothetical protein